ncbi:SWAP domain splicing regulatory protein [Nitzschia inconspicua]|uniref:SWAP domain splicing regulatory protein n=1 Tax=Nitzschia inconspicua TaxID=303405 RepID=A0A9K3L9F0_9STRA|nr:SWAP domain splicing regulatory protein [Nitzschia inconspicua]
MPISGIIRPPPEIRAVADKTAKYVAKNGRAFEVKILSSDRGKTPKFAFLQSTSPFHAYYEDRIAYYKEHEDEEDATGGDKGVKINNNKEKKNDTTNTITNTTTPSGPPVPPSTRKKEKTQKASAIDPIAKALLTERNKILKARRMQQQTEEEAKEDNNNDDKKIAATDNTETSRESDLLLPPPPPPLDFVSIAAPYNLSPTQMDTIQLVAQFTAMDGKGGPFLHQLTLREWNNPEFAFCQPRHAHFAYFSALVDAYRKILREWTAHASSVGKKNHHTSTTTSPVAGNVTPEDILQQAAYRAEYERDQKLQQEQKQQEEGEVVAIDWHDFVVVETIDFPADEMVIDLLPPPPSTFVEGTSTTTTTKPMASTGKSTDDDGMDESSSDDDDGGETIRVVPSYQPKVVGAANLQSTRAIDPITGKSVNIQDVPEHLRIQLLDPKWAEERRKFQEKQKDSNLVEGDAMVANISRLARDMEGSAATKKPMPASASVSAAAPMVGSTVPPVAPNKRSNMSNITESGSGIEPISKRPRMDLQPPKIFSVQETALSPPTNIPPPPPPPPRPSTTVDSSRGGLTEDGPDAPPSIGTEESKQLLSEEDFRASLASPDVTLQIKIPNDSTQMAWNFYGQMVTLQVNVMTKVKDVKAQLSQQYLNDMPANKIVLKDIKGAGGYLSNTATLAALNIGPTATLDMSLKQRGGRK